MTNAAGYEFSASENATFKRLVDNLKRTGVVAVLASVILLLYHFIDYFGLSLGATGSPAVLYIDYAVWFLLSIIGIVTGVLLIRATAAFSALIHTEGNDIAHLMQGMARLSGILGLVFVAGAVASVLLAVSFALLLFFS
jgi:hypothetical protein